jgi:hypothetical protein
MKPVFLNYFVDLGLLITALVCSITGLLKWKELQTSFGFGTQGPPSMSGGNITAFAHGGGIHAQDSVIGLLTPIHEWAGVSTVFFALIHLVLHRHWLMEMTRKVFLRK